MSRWTEMYREKLRTPDEAAALIPDGSYVMQGLAVGEPPAMLEAVANRAKDGGFTNLRMTSLLPMGASARTILQPELRDVIHWVAGRILYGA